VTLHAQLCVALSVLWQSTAQRSRQQARDTLSPAEMGEAAGLAAEAEAVEQAVDSAQHYAKRRSACRVHSQRQRAW
jgi:hypothetical protein